MNFDTKLPKTGFLTPAYVKHRYGISNSTMYSWLAKAHLPPLYPVGPRARRFRAEDLHRFEQEKLQINQAQIDPEVTLNPRISTRCKSGVRVSIERGGGRKVRTNRSTRSRRTRRRKGPGPHVPETPENWTKDGNGNLAANELRTIEFVSFSAIYELAPKAPIQALYQVNGACATLASGYHEHLRKSLAAIYAVGYYIVQK